MSSDDENATTPYLLTRPYVGFIPTTPQKDAGCLMDPPVSDPMAAAASPAATAAAHPPLEPPGTLPGSQGFRVTWKIDVSVVDPMANSSMLVLPTMTAPAARRRSATVASYGGMKFSSIFEQHVVRIP